MSRQTRFEAERVEVIDVNSSLARLLADWAWAERGMKSKIQNPKPAIAERAREAERLLRECLAMRQRGPDVGHWRTTGEAPSRLGSALVAVAVTEPAITNDARIAKLSKAESLLLGGNEVLQQDEKVETKYKRDATTRLVRLYEAWDKPEKAAEWKQKLADIDKSEEEKVTGESDESSEP